MRIAAQKSLLSLSRSYIPPTFLVLGLVAVYLRLVKADPPLPPWRFNGLFVGRMLAASCVLLLGTYVFVRLFQQLGLRA